MANFVSLATTAPPDPSPSTKRLVLLELSLILKVNLSVVHVLSDTIVLVLSQSNWQLILEQFLLSGLLFALPGTIVLLVQFPLSCALLESSDLKPDKD